MRVLWNINALRLIGSEKKLTTKWVGPYEIVEMFNEGQSIRIKPIPLLSPNVQSMNVVNVPKRGIKDQIDPLKIDSFVVPRDQLKPYLRTWNVKFDELQSPLQKIVTCLRIEPRRCRSEPEKLLLNALYLDDDPWLHT